MIQKFFENVKNEWKFNLLHFGLMIIVLLIATTSFYNGDYTLRLPPKNIFANITYIVTILMTIIFYIIIKLFEKKNIKLEKLYLTLIIPLGIMYVIANPLGKIPDEVQHARKSMLISRGVFFAHTNDEGVPVDTFNTKLHELVTGTNSNYEDYFYMVNIPEDGKTIELTYSMATYAPICHLPQAIGMFITRIFGGNIVVQCYAARIVNMLVAIFLMYYAIKLIPFKKQIVFFLGLLPLTISEFASMSSDALTIASCILFISYILYLKYDKNKVKINKKDYAILGTLSVIIALCKIVYIPLCLLLFILPKEKFKSKKVKNIVVWSIFILAVAINLLWLLYAAGTLTEVNPGVNAPLQVQYILTHPISYSLILFRTIHIYTQTFLLSLCGEGLGDYNIQSSPLFVFSCLIIFAILFLVNDDKDRENFNPKTKLFILSIFIVIVALVYTSLYVAWTAVETPIILGVQSRYFLPVILLTAIVFDNKEMIFNYKFKNKYLTSFMLFFNLNTLSCITYTYIFDFIISYYIK